MKRVLVLVAGLLLWAVSATAQQGPTAFTKCVNGTIEVHVNAKDLQGAALRAAFAREGVHVRQYRRYTTCLAADLAWHDSVGTVLPDTFAVLEAEASCAEARYLTDTPVDQWRNLMQRSVLGPEATVTQTKLWYTTWDRFCPWRPAP